MSVSLTEDAVVARRKTVTRRKGWTFLRPGDRLTLCRKVMGRKAGEPLVRLAEVEVVDVRREPLDWITNADVDREGVPPEVYARGDDHAPRCDECKPIAWAEWYGRTMGATGNSPMHGIHSDRIRDTLAETFGALAERLRGALIMCGDWTRVVTPAVLGSGGSAKPCGIFLDPPYADTANRTADLYAKDSTDVAHAVREWAIANGENPAYRIVLCGYEGEHTMPDSWTELAWKAHGGYEGQAKGGRTGNSRRERVWFSPHCQNVGLWDAA